MNKNQKHDLSTYSNLIYGESVVERFLHRKISELSDKIAKALRPGSRVPVEHVLEWKQKKDELQKELTDHEDTCSRYVLQRAVCGDPIVVVR